MKIVIAGKNQCAVDVHKYFKNKYPQHELIGVANSDDDVNDGDIVDEKGFIIRSDTIVEFVYLNFKEDE